MQISSKLPNVGTTIFSIVSRQAAENGAVNLGQGFPDFDTPEPLQEAVIKAIRDGQNQYAPDEGMPQLREQVALKTENLYGTPVSADDGITITTGASEAIFASIVAVVGKGDEVIVFDPAYDLYEPSVTLQGGKTIHIPLDPESFSIDWQRVRDAITKRTRMIIVNTPHNPSGAVMSAKDLDTLADITRDTDIVILSDEVYQHIVYKDGGHQSVWQHEELAQRSFVVSSFGKTWNCTGWKVGYCLATNALMAEFRKVHQFMSFCTSRPFQVGLAHVLEHHPEHYQNLSMFYQKRRDYFRDLIKDSRFKLLDVEGGFFQLVDYSEISQVSDMEFSEWLVYRGGVAAIPVSPFYAKEPDLKLVRLCFAKTDKTLEMAAERLNNL